MTEHVTIERAAPPVIGITRDEVNKVRTWLLLAILAGVGSSGVGAYTAIKDNSVAVETLGGDVKTALGVARDNAGSLSSMNDNQAILARNQRMLICEVRKDAGSPCDPYEILMPE